MGYIRNNVVRRLLEHAVRPLPDKAVVMLQYRLKVGRWPNFTPPKRFSEKIAWYKLNYRDARMTQCVDKHLEKQYLAEKGLGEYVPKTLQVADRIEDIDWDALPQRFIIKCNNGYGNNVTVHDKQKMDRAEIIKTFNQWHTMATIVFGREWAFYGVEPKIMVEELLVSDDGSQQRQLNDYKVMCFGGVPRVVWVDIDRAADHRRNFYDVEWNLLQVESDCPMSRQPIARPGGLPTMLDIARRLSRDFPFVRVDFYYVNGRVYIGEMTFYPWSGCVRFTPDSFDFQLGEMFRLP